ncbi:MAG: peptidase A8, partial [Betaproteobacteria bacterium]|nr:peptidase A8 [Betaproteobacteria bacterium]
MDTRPQTALRQLSGLLRAGLLLWCSAGFAQAAAACNKPVYLTLDTGHMEVAPLMAEVLQRQQVMVTFFAADEPTRTGDGSLGTHWAPWWRARAAEGHAFASHTLDHVYWRADLPDGRLQVRPSAGAQAGQTQAWT